MVKNKFLHTLESCLLCLRFPFLYPRNRFTDRHQVGILSKYTYNLHNKSTKSIIITGCLNEEKKHFDSFIDLEDVIIELNNQSNCLIVEGEWDRKEHSLNNLLNNDKFEILGISLSNSFTSNTVVKVHVVTKDESDKTNYGFHYENIEIITDPLKYKFYKLIRWLDTQILDRILFIPTFNELDSMDYGWRKAFGIQMCKEIKDQLKKEHYLYSYRITQIKEKWGYLHWYDAGGSKEIHDIIQKYEDLSWNTCVICGKPSTKISASWICPYCDEHFPDKSRIYQEKINGKWITSKEYEMVY